MADCSKVEKFLTNFFYAQNYKSLSQRIRLVFCSLWQLTIESHFLGGLGGRGWKADPSFSRMPLPILFKPESFRIHALMHRV